MAQLITVEICVVQMVKAEQVQTPSSDGLSATARVSTQGLSYWGPGHHYIWPQFKTLNIFN